MGDVVPLTVVPGDGYHADADALLDAGKGKLRNAVLIGWDADGQFYLGHTDGAAETNLLLDLAKRSVLDGCFED